MLAILLRRLTVFAVVDQCGVDKDGQDVKDVSEEVGVVGQVNDTASYDLKSIKKIDKEFFN